MSRPKICNSHDWKQPLPIKVFLKQCHNIKLKELLAEGGFGMVYTTSNPNILVKHMLDPLEKEEDVQEVQREMRYFELLSKAQIAPGFLGYSFVSDKRGETTAMVLMRPFGQSLEDARNEGHRLKGAGPAMYKLFKKMGKMGLMCLDQKPSNVLVKLTKAGDVSDMRLIDFGGRWCGQNKWLERIRELTGDETMFQLTLQTLMMVAFVVNLGGSFPSRGGAFEEMFVLQLIVMPRAVKQAALRFMRMEEDVDTLFGHYNKYSRDKNWRQRNVQRLLGEYEDEEESPFRARYVYDTS